jgi:hypothetical protein
MYRYRRITRRRLSGNSADTINRVECPPRASKALPGLWRTDLGYSASLRAGTKRALGDREPAGELRNEQETHRSVFAESARDRGPRSTRSLFENQGFGSIASKQLGREIYRGEIGAPNILDAQRMYKI